MSMNAKFVQVEEAELKKIQGDPSRAEALFEEGPVIPPAFDAMAKMMQERLRAGGPKLMADMLSRIDPRVRERLEQRMGRSAQELASGAGGEELLKLMEERRASLAGKGAAGAARTVLSLDKDWHGVHYLLCGLAEPGAALESKAVMGGTDIGEDDEGFSGYGPARYFTPQQVGELSQALSRAGLEAEAAARFDSAEMNKLQIYPGFRPADAESLLAALGRLRDFYADAAAKGRAIVTCLV